MDPTRTTLFLQAAFALTAFGWRLVMQRRRTGSTGFVVQRDRGLIAKVTGLSMVIGVVLLAAGTVLAPESDWSTLAVAGTAAMICGLTLTLAAQQAMGASWRIGVDPKERTELITAGLFGRVRNPIFTAMLTFALGGVLAVPGLVTGLGFCALAAGIVGQVRLVEEPYLSRQHGPDYEHYRARTGRFFPRVT